MVRAVRLAGSAIAVVFLLSLPFGCGDGSTGEVGVVDLAASKEAAAKKAGNTTQAAARGQGLSGVTKKKRR